MFYHSPFNQATFAQIERLKELGIDPPDRLSRYQADQLIKANYDQWAALPPTPKQRYFLERHFSWQDDLTRGQAAEMIAKLNGKNDWPLGKPKKENDSGER
jgi:hypothetical protein